MADENLSICYTIKSKYVIQKNEYYIYFLNLMTLARTGAKRRQPIEQVQKILGHEQIDTTLRYAMVNQNNVKLSHRKYIS